MSCGGAYEYAQAQRCRARGGPVLAPDCAGARWQFSPQEVGGGQVLLDKNHIILVGLHPENV